jgi:site-specific DNA-methyltransferase (adenine-specific)
MTAPYFDDGTVTLYLGDCREILRALGITADLIVTDPPYNETNLSWDSWQDHWLNAATTASRSMWCFGSMRMYLDHGHEFTVAGWHLSQDVVWRKQNGTSLAADRFRRVHEHALHWYRGAWSKIHHDTPRERHYGRNEGERVMSGQDRGAHLGLAGARMWADDGTRLVKSVIDAANSHKRSLHPTEKPVPMLDLLIRYGCPVGGLVLDPFAGSASTLQAAALAGRRAIGIEAHEPYAEVAARRLSQGVLDLDGVA